MSKPAIKVFISYAHKDNDFFDVFNEGLKTHLYTSDKYDFGEWEDSRIYTGSFWDNEIQENLKECGLAILCVSGHFLNSKYIEAKEFGNLINKYPDTLIIPVYFNHCNFKSWDELSKRQFFKPLGNRYGKAADDDFSFCDLVELTAKDGRFIPVPNAKRDLYFQDIVLKIEEALSQKTTKSRKTQNLKKDILFNYITRSYPFFEKDSFFGRDELLKKIDALLKKQDIPVLLSGIGGMGKTAAAIAYGSISEYRSSYDNIAWIDVTENIFSNIFSTFLDNPVIPFQYSPDGEKTNDIANIMEMLRNVSGNNLLLLDNANDEKDLQQFISEWKEYQPGWKCLVTTRCENNAYKNHLIKLEIISLKAGQDLFKRYNEKNFDEIAFGSIYNYIGGHTFLIELLAKLGQESNMIKSTQELLANLKARGIKELNKTVIAKQGQQQETNKLVSEFVLSLYDPTILSETEKAYLRYFSIFPTSEIEFSKLAFLFGIEENKQDEFDTALSHLVKKGWLIQNLNNFKCHQIIQEICKEKLNPDINNCRILIECLKQLFEDRTITQVVNFFEIGLSIVNNIKSIDFDYSLMQSYFSDRIMETGNFTDGLTLLNNAKEIYGKLNEENNEAICLERMGTIYLLQGNEKLAMDCYLQYNIIEKELSKKHPENDLYKNNLSVSYSKLGELYLGQGEIDNAMHCYQEDMRIAMELSKQNPDDNQYKNSIAISYSRLGDVWLEQGNMDDALKCYLQYNTIEKELSANDPTIMEYKSGVAISYCRLGEIYQDKGNIDEAMTCYVQYNTIKKELYESNPLNMDHKNGVAISYDRLGKIYAEQGNMSEALNNYWQYNILTNELVKTNPENIEYKNGLAISYTNIALLSSPEDSKMYFEKAKEIWTELTIKVPQRTSFKKSLQRVERELKG